MNNQFNLLKSLKQAKYDMDIAEELIIQYMPFIKKEVYKFTNIVVNDDMDELSIAMIAFHEAIRNFNEEKGNFISYAALTIRSRLLDYTKKELRSKNTISLDEKINNDSDNTLEDTLVLENDHSIDIIDSSSTKDELLEFSNQLKSYGISLKDVADNCPKQERTLSICAQALKYSLANHSILEKMTKTKRLPISTLVTKAHLPLKTLERHRKYIVAILLIQTNGFNILRNHIKEVMKGVA